MASPRLPLNGARAGDVRSFGQARATHGRAPCVAGAALFLFLGGCAISIESPHFAPPSFTMTLALDSACAPPDPRIEAIALRLHSIRGRGGYYALRTMAELAVERDEMVSRILAQNRAIEACLPEGPERRAHVDASLQLIDVALRGDDPFEWDRSIVAYDLRLHPRAMPLLHRGCNGHGFEGSLLCLVLIFPAGLADVLSFPLGTWIWAAEDDSVPVDLTRFPPGEKVQAEVAKARARAPGVAPR